MKIKSFTFSMLLAATVLIAASCKNNETIRIKTDGNVEMKNHNDSLSWAMGVNIAQAIENYRIDINRELLFQAICYSLDKKEQPFSAEELTNLQYVLDQQAFINIQQKKESSLEAAREKEKIYFEQLTRENPNVKKSDKGFYYEVLKEGSGMQGAPGMVVEFDYKGSFTNGQVFDQTYGNREPIVHVIGETLMPGLFEGLCMMRSGSHYRFYFPSEIAFGARGTEDIPPYTAVIYEVEVHSIHE